MWILAVMVVAWMALMSATEHDHANRGLNVGDRAPDFDIPTGALTHDILDTLDAFVASEVPVATATGNLSANNPPREAVGSSSDKASRPDECAPRRLRDLRGRYVLLSFWAAYDAPSRMANAAICHAAADRHIDLVSVNFDRYRSIFLETTKQDSAQATVCFYEPRGPMSTIYGRYHLGRGFTNYLLDERGVIVAHGLTPQDLAKYLD